MCGILGGCYFGGNEPENQMNWLSGASRLITHRGPDGSGQYQSENGRVWFLHRRLKIVDLTELSSQPMKSRDGSVVLVFNGEIYNYKRLRDELKSYGHNFTTSGDTEVLICAYVQWGCDFVKYLDGMYSIGIYDKKKSALLLFRDHFGEKPLYYTICNNYLFFCSEIRPLIKRPNFTPMLSQEAIEKYLCYGASYGKKTLIRGIYKIIPSSFLSIDLKTGNINEQLTKGRSFQKVEVDTSFSTFDNLLTNTVASRLKADVPTGVLLSGGLDSSIIVAKAAENQAKLKTFNVLFQSEKKSNQDNFNAKLISRHFKTEHYQLKVKELSVEDLHYLLTNFDEIINDPSILPTYSVYKEVMKNCKVVLGGDGADEMFGGYRRYLRANSIESFNNKIPNWIKSILAPIFQRFLKEGSKGRHFTLMSLANDLPQATFLPTLFPFAAINKLLPNYYPRSSYDLEINRPLGVSLLNLMMDFDKQYYLPDDILHKVDRCSMLNSIEARSPFLSKAIENFASNIPNKQKTDGISGKIYLKEYGKKILPKTYNFNEKNGFSPPFQEWFLPGSNLRKHAEYLLYSKSCKFDNSTVKTLFLKYDAGYNVTRKIMSLYFLEFWRKENEISWF